MSEKQCVICQTVFTSNNHSEKTCGPECSRKNYLHKNALSQRHRREALRKPSICAVCGVEFKSERPRKTCGVDCAVQRSRQRLLEWRNDPKNAERVRQYSKRCSEKVKTERRARRVIEPIPKFPVDIDREAFGSWISGFTDGEGCFALQAQFQERGKNPYYRAKFVITLRDDDMEILQLIQSFFGCGRLASCFSGARSRGSSMPAAEFHVGSTCDLVKFIIPHFEQYPLRAKKRRDFEIWKEAVLLCAAVNERPRTWQKGVRGSRSRWNEDERQKFASFLNSLKSIRKYHNDPVEQLAPEPEDSRGSLPIFAKHD